MAEYKIVLNQYFQPDAQQCSTIHLEAIEV